MPALTAFSFGDVVLVPSPFTDQTGTKRRPAVVITTVEQSLVLRVMGHLSAPDLAALREVISEVIG